ncbi:telomere-associated protein RIF1 [Cololabis saira]|uniref:telomere-associated protein RIF1 n=1 Tax=Cololabis saira TaxID=129043 RepID=UPI002AD5459E|nr:telomere-associated protein RIF1 [Cololabis saira]XP_061580097.1 telomere-associated protein RIF1 [Cololabis saira]
MMATTGPLSTNSFLPLLESLEDSGAGPAEQTDAYLTIANRLSGEEGRQFLPAVEKHFSRFGKAILAHIASPNADLSQAALQALGFCVYHSQVVAGVSDILAAEILSALCSLVMKSTDKNTCTRALWVISKQSFPTDVVTKKVPAVLTCLESVWSRQDIQSVVMEHEALNVIIRMLEQVTTPMGDAAVQWAKLVIPLVVHSASKVRLRAAAAMEMGMPLLLSKQMEVAAVIEPIMSSKLIPELQKLFMSKNETNVLKLWPLFVKLLGKLLHRGGPFINSLLHLEELGFRSSSPTIKKIAFIAWKSLIDNFALNPDILSSAKRMKLLMQPLASIHVRTEALMLTKVEVWWYLVVQLGSNLSPNFDQVSLPLLQSTIGSDSSSVPGTPSRSVTQNGAVAPSTPKTGTSFNASASTPRMSLNSSLHVSSTFPSIQLLGLEMVLHYVLGPEVVVTAAKNKVTLSLEPLKQPLLTSAPSFSKHAAVLISNVRDGFINVGKDAPESLLTVIWTSLIRFVNLTIDSVGSKKERQGCEALTLLLQALQSIVASEALPTHRVLILFEATVKKIPPRVLGSASYQVGKMDVLNGTPALFLILLLFNSSMLPVFTEDERFFHCLQMLVGCGLSGPASPLAFAEAVLGAVSRSAGILQNKERLWRMWSVMVAPLTDSVTQSNEVNQGDALEHNFSAMYSAFMFPVTHLLRGSELPQVTQKSMLSSWSKLYKVFARCSALVVTAEENLCCEELCVKIAAAVDKDALAVPSMLNAVSSFLQVMVECVDFSPFTPHFQQKPKSPHTPGSWTRKPNKVLGNLSTLQSLLVQCLQVYVAAPEDHSEGTGSALVSIQSTLFTSLALTDAVQEALSSLVQPLALLCKQAAGQSPKFTLHLLGKLEKLLGEILSCLQTRSASAYDDELLALVSPLLCVAFPHKSKMLRASTAQFWNATFGNAVSLTYPELLRPVLSQVKHKIPILLPGFQVVSGPHDSSEMDSSESSQLETKLSGMPVSSAGKRDSLLGKAAELIDKNSTRSPRPVSTKLDFSSPKPLRREVLEEEASIDFVFIPPEAKERVLTEHQKEVKRTKRVDIPAMYNNLDASLDTTVFSQYTQSQEDSSEKTQTEQAAGVAEEVNQKEEGMDKDADVLDKETQDFASPKEEVTVISPPENVTSNSADASVEDHKNSAAKAEDVDTEAKDDTSPNTSNASDLVSGTPQKHNSRRQSFITLEKYTEAKPASPSGAFTGPLAKTSDSQKNSSTVKTSSPEAALTSAGSNSQESAQTGQTIPASDAPDSPRRPRDSRSNGEPVRLIERLSNDSTEEDEDAIPDTQTEMESNVDEEEEDMKSSSQEEESESMLDDSQSSLIQTAPDEVRRSGRPRLRPQLPGEDPEEREAKYTHLKRRHSGEDGKAESLKTTEAGMSTRSKQATEGNRLRTRSQGSLNESGQKRPVGRPRKKVRLYSSSEGLLLESSRRSGSDLESSQTDVRSDTGSDHDSQSSVRRRGRLKKPSLTSETPATSTEEISRTVGDDSAALVDKEEQPEPDAQTVVAPPQTDSKLEEVQPQEKHGKDDEELQEDSEIAASPSSQTESLEKEDFPMVTSTPADISKDQATPKLEAIGDPNPAADTMDENLSQDDSQNLSQDDSQTTPLSSDGRTKRRSRRVKASSEESQDKDGNAESTGPRRRSQASTPVALPEAGTRGRLRKSKLQDETPKSRSTPNNSQSLDESESSQGRGRYSRRRSQQTDGIESSELENSEFQDKLPPTKRRGRKPRASLQSPPAPESQERRADEEKLDGSQTVDIQGSEPKPDTEEPSETQGLQESQQVAGNVEEQGKDGSPMETETRTDATLETVSDDTKEIDGADANESAESPCKQTDDENVSSQGAEVLDSVEPDDQQILEPRLSAGEALASPSKALASPSKALASPSKALASPAEGLASPSKALASPSKALASPSKALASPSKALASPAEGLASPSKALASPADALTSPRGEIEEPHISEVSENQASGAAEADAEEQASGPDPEHQNPSNVPEENAAQEEEPQKQIPSAGFTEEEERPASARVPEASAEADVAPLQEDDEDGKTMATAEATCKDQLGESWSTPAAQDSPVKQTGLETPTGPDVGESPSDGRSRGTWSPSASPSTSILKKGQKRPLEVETISPLVKSRRVSFANPIHHQETADDIDRRSPAVRTSSPRRSKGGSIPQLKLITTPPTKGLLNLSPRHLHSPGYRSSKKCLISEMGQEPRAVSRDCVYPALVGCSAPVEAVLPQISSTMWSRGFGKLVRARNIKTVGDLSALTPSEIKTLPIRSPKVPNVRKALKAYEQQRKGRGGDELKSFDETEMMTSELDEPELPPNLDEEEKPSGEVHAAALEDEPPSADVKPDQDASEVGPPDGLDGDGSRLQEEPQREDLPSALEALTCRVTPLELRRCSPQQLGEMHAQLGGAMGRVVEELQARLCGAELKH